MAKKFNNPALAPSEGEGWDAWGEACGFSSWAKAAEAIGITVAQMVTIRKKAPRRTIRLAMDAVLAARQSAQPAQAPTNAITQPMSAWQPIETISEKVSKALGWDGETIEVMNRSVLHPQNWCFCDGELSYIPTHWMPLPAAPKREGE